MNVMLPLLDQALPELNLEDGKFCSNKQSSNSNKYFTVIHSLKIVSEEFC